MSGITIGNQIMSNNTCRISLSELFISFLSHIMVIDINKSFQQKWFFLLDGESNLLLSFASGGVSKVRTGFHPRKMAVSVALPKK